MIKVFFAPGTGFDIDVLIMQFLCFSLVELGELFEGAGFFLGGWGGLFIHGLFLHRLGVLPGVLEGGVGFKSIQMIEYLEGVAGLSFH